MKKKKMSQFLICFAAAAVLLAPTALAAGEGVTQLVPGGFTVGITLECDGVIVTGLTEPAPGVSPAGEAGVLPGDVIVMLDQKDVCSAGDLKSAVASLSGEPTAIKIVRAGETIQYTVTPYRSGDGVCSLGLWLRDGLSGIGTVTFYDPDSGTFGALGHAVNDIDTGITVPLRSGSLLHASVTDIVKGVCGAPGQLIGVFESGGVIGALTGNTSSGIFGDMFEVPPDAACALPVAAENEIRTGAATILSNIAGTEVAEYDIDITRVYVGGGDGRSMMIKVTDPDLIDATGGIVQGMSGSPILQGGRIVGAVTHVLVNDPTRGYAISIQDMLESAGIEEKAA